MVVEAGVVAGSSSIYIRVIVELYNVLIVQPQSLVGIIILYKGRMVDAGTVIFTRTRTCGSGRHIPDYTRGKLQFVDGWRTAAEDVGDARGLMRHC